MPRNPKLVYKAFKRGGKETDDMIQAERIITQLKGSKIKSADKLAKELYDITEEKKKLNELEKSVKIKARKYVEDIFDTADNAYTRVVETADTVLTLSKQNVSRKESFQVEKFMQAVAKMTGVAEDQLEKLRDKFTEVVETPREPSVKGSVKEEGFKEMTSSVIKFLKNIGSKFKRVMVDWFDESDKLLADMQKMLANEFKYESYQGYEKYLSDIGVF